MRKLIVVVALLLSSATAQAKLTPSVYLGMLEAIGTEGEAHLGIYATLGAGLTIPLNDRWALIPQVGFEMAPEFGNWGATMFLVLDRLIYEAKSWTLTLDPYVGLIHDALPDGTGGFAHTAYLGGGVGPSFIFGKLTLAPSLGVYGDVKSGAVVLNPTLLFIVSF